ncbi:VOC family protein [Nocardioides solisilvae]|uniref:VOC family protein n=1 Tax=Nocardioides solisilvae TaxID=1542435 RepID=UPI000D74F0D5|nr:VOC family protein [Nocardioides solisilvae]
MSLVTWQDLCLDALDVPAQARFWAAVSGLEVDDPAAPARLVGPSPRHTIWVNQVDRPHVVKNRTHLDVDCASLDDLLALGATVEAASSETGLPWTRMQDPEGNEFCAFVREGVDVPTYRLHGVGVDCVDPEAQARWWGEAFGVEPVHEGAGEERWWSITGAAVDERMTLDFNAVPEPRTEPNRLHWHVVGEVDALLARGATHLWDQPRWTVLADPEGNEFCVFPPTT